jgi:hypothetical protein
MCVFVLFIDEGDDSIKILCLEAYATCNVKGAQAWEFYAHVFCTKRTHLGMRRRTVKKIKIFYQLTADFDVFWFFAAYWVCGKQTKNLKLGQN